jgi:hypothetical protein
VGNLYVFTSPSWVSGAARLVDLGGTYDQGSYWVSATPAEADARAWVMDLNAVHADVTAGAEACEQEESVQEEEAA